MYHLSSYFLATSLTIVLCFLFRLQLAQLLVLKLFCIFNINALNAVERLICLAHSADGTR